METILVSIIGTALIGPFPNLNAMINIQIYGII